MTILCVALGWLTAGVLVDSYLIFASDPALWYRGVLTVALGLSILLACVDLWRMSVRGLYWLRASMLLCLVVILVDIPTLGIPAGAAVLIVVVQLSVFWALNRYVGGHVQRRHSDMVIRAFRDGDLAGVVNCFTESVRVIAARHYGGEQIDAWAPLKPDLDSWRGRLSTEYVLVAEVQGAITGFVRVEQNGLVDLLYVAPAHERRGLGRKLLNAACSWAGANGAKRLEANVSLAARPLFEAVGFHVEREQSVEYKGIVFRNFRMAREEGSVPAAEQANAASAHQP